MQESAQLYIREELEARLEKMWESDASLLAQCLARHALRCLPLLAMTSEHFPYWQNTTTAKVSTASTDQSRAELVCRHLLSLYLGPVMALQWTGKNDPDAPKTEIDKNIIQFKYGPRIVREITREQSSEFPLAYAIAYAADAAVYCANAQDGYEVYPFAATALDKLSEFSEWESSHIDSDFRSTGPVIIEELIQLYMDDLESVETNNANFNTENLFPNPDLAIVQSGIIDRFIVHCQQLREDFSNTPPVALNHLIEFYATLIRDSENASTAKTKATDSVSPETIRDATVDHLGRHQLVNGIASIFTAKENKGHLTVGLFGHWGSGKTRVIDLLRHRLNHSNLNSENHDNDFLFGEFNAWRYEHSKNIQAAMAHEIIQALTSNPYATSFKPKRLAGLWNRTVITLRYVSEKHPNRLIWLVLLSFFMAYSVYEIFPLLTANDVNVFANWKALWGLAIPISLVELLRNLRTVITRPFTKELMSYLKLPSYAEHIGLVSEMKDDIHKMCEASLRQNRRLLFVVDDLDRCGPEGIIRTFEAVRLILDIPQVRIVIAVDQRIALAALAHHYREIADHHELRDAKAIAHDYLGKMIHIPITLSAPNMNEMIGYLGHVWSDKSATSQQWQSLLDDVTQANLELEYTVNGKAISKNGIESQGFAREDQFTLDQLDEWVATLPETNAGTQKRTTKVDVGMSIHQKAAFAYWAQRFRISNPRQLKRLTNSYNLIRLVSNEEDIEIPQARVKGSFGILVCLFALEFINTLENSNERFHYKKAIFNNQFNDISRNSDRQLLKLTLSILDQTTVMKPNYKTRSELINFVDQFVLPAITNSPETEVI
jgi:hypothetical protein